jgi:hypothetical protein
MLVGEPEADDRYYAQANRTMNVPTDVMGQAEQISLLDRLEFPNLKTIATNGVQPDHPSTQYTSTTP